MTIPWLIVATLALSLERVSYVWADWHPAQFERAVRAVPLCRHLGPVGALMVAFGFFKAIQFTVFASWIVGNGGWCSKTASTWWVAAAGAIAVLVGQTLNVQVFSRLGTTAVFYGNRFGLSTAHCTAFPFSVLRHPQYVGTCLSIWGLFLIVRFPCDDWIALPVIEAALYTFTAILENRPRF